MSSHIRKRKFNKWIILPILGSAILVVMLGIVVSGFWYKSQCNKIYDEINASVVKSGMKIYAEYDERKVEISRPNINYVINSITNRMVLFTSADKMPQTEPVILQFGDELLMEVYPNEGYGVFVKHATDKKTNYYLIENTCNFNNLKKMVSLDEWSYPNILVGN
jgi:hypothetical protein